MKIFSFYKDNKKLFTVISYDVKTLQIIKETFKNYQIKKDSLGKLLKDQDKTEKTCQVCGKKFKGSKKRKYCSNACRLKAYRQRKKQKSNF